MGGVRVDVNEELKFEKLGGRGLGGRQVGWGGRVGSRLGEVGLGGQGGCEGRIEVFVKIPKKKIEGGGVSGQMGGGVGGGGGVTVDVNEELKFLGK